MLTQVSVIGDEARRHMEEELEKHFDYKQGQDLSSVVDEVLNDQQLFTFLAVYLPKNKGILLGRTIYHDDMPVHLYYGLTLDFNQDPRETKLFFVRSPFETYGTGKEYETELRRTFPSYEIDRKNYKHPSPEQFIREVNEVLKNPKERLVDLICP